MRAFFPEYVPDKERNDYFPSQGHMNSIWVCRHLIPVALRACGSKEKAMTLANLVSNFAVHEFFFFTWKIIFTSSCELVPVLRAPSPNPPSVIAHNSEKQWYCARQEVLGPLLFLFNGINTNFVLRKIWSFPTVHIS